MTTLAHVVIERTTHVTPFGLGFWDVATGRRAVEELAVRVHTLSGARVVRTVVARPNRTDIYVAQEFPELRVFESGAGDDTFWLAQSPPHPYMIEVRDPTGRFTPFVTHVAIPSRGLAISECVLDLWPTVLASPPSPGLPPSAEPPAFVPLFGTPARAVPAGLAAARATLVNSVSGAPAVWAVLEVRYGGALVARGIADARGEVVAMFAYPEPPAPPTTSPTGGATSPQPLAMQSWPIEIAVRYDADLALYQPDPRTTPLADLCELLQQPFATVRTSSPPAPLTDATLLYGQELILGKDAGATLFIDPA